MQTIRLKQLKLLNFKGTRNLTIPFNQVTNIFGDNATGKTTVFDAFTWLLFGKDSSNRQKFEIKTLDSLNRVIPKIDHEVHAVIEVSGEEIEIKRILKEKWVKKRGSIESEFSGNVTEYFWNDVPLQLKEWEGKIGQLIDEGIFKLITNPLYFNSLKWQDRRSVLTRLTGELTNDEVAQGNDQFIKLITGLKTKTIEEYKREIAARKKKLNDSLKTIPTRIDEATRSLPDNKDFDAIRKEIEDLKGELATVEGLITNKSKALENAQSERTKIQGDVFSLKTKTQNIEFEEKQKLSSLENEGLSTLNNLESELRIKNAGLGTIEGEIKSQNLRKPLLEEKTNKLREDWNVLNAEEIKFNENEFACPTCKRDFEAKNIEEKKTGLINNFQNDKSQKLGSIQKEGLLAAEQVTKLEQEINSSKLLKIGLSQEISSLEEKILLEKEKVSGDKPQPTLEGALKNNQEYQGFLKQITELEGSVKEPIKVDTTELQESKSNKQTKINQLGAELNDEATIKKTKLRISELEEEERTLAQQISDLEGTEFTIDSFI